MVLDGWLKDFRSPIKSPPSPPTDVSLKLFRDMNDESIKVTSSSWPLIRGSATEEPTLKLGNGVEEWKKPEVVGGSSWWLFGIDLMNHSKSMTTISEKAIAAPTLILSATPIKGPKPTSVEESDRHSGHSKASREQKQGLDSSPKEIQSKHKGSTRSRTKVEKKRSLSYKHQGDLVFFNLELLVVIE